ncbi:MAG TPA: cytochrome P450, partial [Thermomicrobiales bacterium]|nr:cytochrome P450 [Thermomicrobiales bacterium]
AGGSFALPVFVIGGLLGIPDDALAQTVAWVDDFTRCLAPASGPEQIERGKAAAGHLHALVQTLAPRDGRSSGVLMRALAREARRAGIDDRETVVANGIGLLAQAYEATAGAIGATLLALGRSPAARQSVDAAPNLLGPAIAETLRHDPSIQNTRRVVAEDGSVAGRDLRTGDVILVVLAAANRDPAANPDPGRFDLDRRQRRMLTFGAGAHACPGAALAMTIARAGVERALAAGLSVPPNGKIAYRPSANVRVPLLPVGRRGAW